jgi:pimeloyl-ACP methyl ester carboxylesterase
VFSEGQGSPLLMLGGGTVGAGEFAPHATSLANNYRVVRLQTLNIERAQKKVPLPAGYSLKTESGAMERTLRQLELTVPADIVGHSLGALVALDFALDHPNRVHTLVLAEPPAFWVVPDGELQADKEMMRMVELTRELVPDREPTDEQMVRFRCALGSCGEKPPDAGDPAFATWAARRAALRGLSMVAAHKDDPSRLKSFRKPVLIVTGSTTIGFHRRINDILAGYFPIVERVELPGTHSAVATGADQFVFALRAFLARHRSER